VLAATDVDRRAAGAEALEREAPRARRGNARRRKRRPVGEDAERSASDRDRLRAGRGQDEELGRARNLRLLALADADAELSVASQLRQLEVLTKISGVSFDEARQDSKTFELDGHQIPYIGKAALIVNKKAAGRHKDLADVEELERVEET
jgi:hypothetical protein